MCTHSDEVAACERVRERVNELLLEAARAVCPDYCGLWASRCDEGRRAKAADATARSSTGIAAVSSECNMAVSFIATKDP